MPALQVVLLITYLGVLVTHGSGYDLTVGRLAVLNQLLPAAICWAAVAGAGARRGEVVLLAAGMTCYAAGYALFTRAAALNAVQPFPAPADVGLLAFYPLVLAAIVLAVRRSHRGIPAAARLDSLVCALGATTLLALVLGPVFAETSGTPLQIAVALAYPVSDLVLVATVVAVAALHGFRLDRHWLALLVGLTVFATADIVYALRVIQGSYVVGTPLDGLLAVGMALISVWSRGGARTRPVERPAVLVVPVLATVTGLAVLVAASRRDVPPLAVGLATTTLVASAVRTQLAFRQLTRLADLRRQATTDDLTGLPNRRAFYDGVNRRLAARRERGQALLLLDLDRFKEINDSLGHHVGDRLLVDVGARLSEKLRDGDLLARLGGDEYAVWLEDVDAAQAVTVATGLRAALADAIVLEGIALRTDVSIGVALCPEHGTDLSTLLRRADVAMYRSKKARNGPHVSTGDVDAPGDQRLRTLQQLRAALAEDQLTVHYQPKVDLGSGAVRGVEALVRWDHPVRGLLYPDSFLELAEDAGLMAAVTQQVLEQALDQAARWRAGGRPLTVAVNLSATSLVDSELPAQVRALLAGRGLPAGALQLEITEELLMGDRDRARAILTELRDDGVQIAIDDFGTGYSSLAYLRDLPIDELKLDRSFVFPMADDARASALVASTIALSHGLGLRMVAEGVENDVALAELTRMGCDQAQGYYLCRPVPPAELDHWLDRRAREAALRPPGNDRPA